MFVYVQRRDGEFASANEYAAWYGFRALGAELAFFERRDLEHVPLAPDRIVVGGISTVRRALALLDRPAPALPDVPPALAPYARRRMGEFTMGEIRARVAGGEPLFLKPRSAELKTFNGHVATRYADLIRTAALDDAHVVLASEVVRFVREYRTYVRRRALVDWRPYRGRPGPAPDVAVAEACVAAWADQPAAYALDLGVLADGAVGAGAEGATAVVEVNDGYALGCYGLNPLEYAALLAERWYELTGRPDLAAELPPVKI